MIEDLMKLKKQIDTVIETYKDLAPVEYQDYVNYIENNNPDNIGSTIGIASMTDDEYSQTHTAHRDDDERVRKINKDYEKEIALKRVREGYYENSFSEKQRKKAAESSEGSSSLCVYGDS